jgi:hypothetical protein
MDYRDNHHRIAKFQLKWPSFTPPWWSGFTPPLTRGSGQFGDGEEEAPIAPEDRP